MNNSSGVNSSDVNSSDVKSGSTSLSTQLGGAARTLGRWLIAIGLIGAGLAHLTFARQEFQAQVPSWFPVDADIVVLASGVVEIALGLAIIVAPARYRRLVGWVIAAFFVAIFPGNIAQYLDGTDAFGLDSDAERLLRLFFQPVFIAAALWSTGAVPPTDGDRSRRPPQP